MSRIGKKPIEIPKDVKIDIAKDAIGVNGPKGNLQVPVPSGIQVSKEEDTLILKVDDASLSPLWGLTRSLIANAIIGVTEGFEKDLVLEGVGYRVKKEGEKISLTLGFSHPVEVIPPEGIEFEIEDNKHIKIKGIDKHLVGLTAAKIRQLRKPEPYKGKGIRYSDEVVRRKPGKSLAGASTM